jgi:hypothetical protein
MSGNNIFTTPDGLARLLHAWREDFRLDVVSIGIIVPALFASLR